MGSATASSSSYNAQEQLRDHLRYALRRGGYGKLTAGPRHLPDRTVFEMVVLTCAGMIGYFAIVVRLDPSQYALRGIIGLLLLMAFFLVSEGQDDSAYFVAFIGTVLFGFVWQVVAVGWGTAVITHFVPFTIALSIIFLVDRFEPITLSRTLAPTQRVLNDLPTLFPLIALVMFALILTTEVWQVGSNESVPRLVALGVVVILPLTWLLRRKLFGSIDRTFEHVAADIVGRKNLADDVRARVRTTAGRNAADWIQQHARTEIEQSFHGADLNEIANVTCKEMRAPFERRITVRLLMTVAAVSIAAFLILYTLSWLMVDEQVAKNWTGVTGAQGSAAGEHLLSVSRSM